MAKTQFQRLANSGFTEFPNYSEQDIRDMLQHVSAICSQQEWAIYAYAIYSHLGEPGWDAFNDWSKSDADSYNHKAAREVWSSVGKRAIKTNIGYLVKRAKAGGWKYRKADLSPAEQKLKAERDARERAEREQRNRQLAEQKAAQTLKDRNGTIQWWNRIRCAIRTPEWLRLKSISEIAGLVGFRSGSDSTGNFIAWPIYDVRGQVQGFERIYNDYNANGGGATKRSAPATNSSEAFFPFCDLNTVDSVYICEGISDAASLYLSGIQNVVAIIGSSNISNIINIIKGAFPHVECIAALDNEPNAIKYMEASGVRFAHPMRADADWNDVFCELGPDGVRAQLSLKVGFLKIPFNNQYVTGEGSPWLLSTDFSGLHLLTSAKGTGKSEAVRLLDTSSKRILIVSYRVGLTKSQAASFNATHYQEIIEDQKLSMAEKNRRLKEAPRLVITLDSLWRIAGGYWDIVFFDECEQGLMHFTARTMRSRPFNLGVLSHLLKTSKTQLLADADLGRLTELFCRRIGLVSGVQWLNHYQPMLGSKMKIFESSDHMAEEMHQQLADKQHLFIAANSKRKIKTLSKELSRRAMTAASDDMQAWYEGGAADYLSVTSDNSQNTDLLQFYSEPRQWVSKLQALLASPSLGTGFDIKAGHGINQTFGWFGPRAGTATMAHQHIARAREVTEFNIWLAPATADLPTDPELIRQQVLEQPTAETLEMLKIEHGETVFSDPLYDWLYCEVTAILNDNKNRFGELFVEQARAEGYEIEFVARSDEQAKSAAARTEAARIELKMEDEQAFRTARLLGDQEFVDASNGQCRVSMTEFKKTKVVRDLDIRKMTRDQVAAVFPMVQECYHKLADDIGAWRVYEGRDVPVPQPEPDQLAAIQTMLTWLEEHGGMVSKIKRLTATALPKTVARALDRSDSQHAESRADWRHHYKVKYWQSKLLSAVGIDEELNYDGTQWSQGCDVVKTVHNILKNNADSLNRFLHLEVGPQHLQEPLKWLNGYLRNLGIKTTSVQHRTPHGRIRVYSIDATIFDAVSSLALSRANGITKHILGDVSVTHTPDNLYKFEEDRVPVEIVLTRDILGPVEELEDQKDDQKNLQKIPVFSSIQEARVCQNRLLRAVHKALSSDGITTERKAKSFTRSLFNQFDVWTVREMAEGELQRRVSTLINAHTNRNSAIIPVPARASTSLSAIRSIELLSTQAERSGLGVLEMAGQLSPRLLYTTAATGQYRDRVELGPFRKVAQATGLNLSQARDLLNIFDTQGELDLTQVARVMAAPSHAHIVIKGAAQSAGIGVLAAYSQLDEFDIADISSGGWGRDDVAKFLMTTLDEKSIA